MRLYVYECRNEMGRFGRSKVFCSLAIFLGLYDAVSYGIFDSLFSGYGMQRRSESRGTSAFALRRIIAVLLPACSLVSPFSHRAAEILALCAI